MGFSRRAFRIGLSAVLFCAAFAAQASAQVGRVSGVVKGEDGQPLKGATITAENPNIGQTFTSTTDDKGLHLFDNVFSIFVRGEGGFGGDRGPETEKVLPPTDRAPDFEVTDAMVAVEGEAMRAVPPGAPAILLTHDPDMFPEVPDRVALTLAGHTHGGQICLPGAIPIMLDSVLPRRMGAGAWTYRGMVGYTAVGVGSCILPVRLNCPPEITLHRLLRDRRTPQ